MRIHTNTLTAVDVYTAAGIAGATVETLTEHGSRSRARAFNVKLSGSSSHRPNDRGRSDCYAATWDEWGIFLAELFKRDDSVTVPNVYPDAEVFHWMTGNRFESLTLAAQHRNHRWEYSGESVTGSYFVRQCSGCEAIQRHANKSALAMIFGRDL